MSEVVGFDFGTTNSLISFVRDGRVTNVLENNLPHPSVVAYQGEQILAGRMAKNLLSDSGLGVMGNIVVSPKSLLGREKIFVEGIPRSPLDIVAELAKHMRRHAADAYPEQSFDHAVVTIPVGMDGQRRRALRDAFLKAGIRIRQFVHEPFAALYAHLRDQGDIEARLRDLDGQLILVFDWGGGTLDLTLCRLRGRTLAQLRSLGIDDVGGDRMDSLVREEVVQRALSQRGIRGETPYQPGARQSLRARAEQAKIELSVTEKALVYVADALDTAEGDDPDLEYWLSREELESICGEIVSKGVRQVDRILEAAGVEPASVALCLATGGMVNMPLIQNRLHEYFGPARLHVSRRGNTIIAEGAAWVAQDRQSLRLAKNLELELARNRYLPLVKADTEMPLAGSALKDNVELYCVDPRDGHAKFQFVAPLSIGKPVAADHRVPLDILTVGVHSGAEPFRERIVLDIEIDQDLVFRATARSALTGSTDFVELHELEFGVSIPDGIGGNPIEGGQRTIGPPSGPPIDPKGSLMLRSNLSCDKRDELIPGELLHQLKPYNFAERPSLQRDEHLYYQPCSVCHRRVDDPRCKCASEYFSSKRRGGQIVDQI